MEEMTILTMHLHSLETMVMTGADRAFKQGGSSHQSKVGVNIRHTITKGVGGIICSLVLE